MSVVTTQLEFGSLTFPGRNALRVEEVAERFSCTTRHVLDLIDEGKLRAVNIAGDNESDRRYLRIPVESVEEWVRANLV